MIAFVKGEDGGRRRRREGLWWTACRLLWDLLIVRRVGVGVGVSTVYDRYGGSVLIHTF